VKEGKPEKGTGSESPKSTSKRTLKKRGENPPKVERGDALMGKSTREYIPKVGRMLVSVTRRVPKKKSQFGKKSKTCAGGKGDSAPEDG